MSDSYPMLFDNPCLGRIVFGQYPAGLLHLGHLLGSIAPIIEMEPRYEMIIVIADGVPGVTQPERIEHVYEITSAWLSAGLSPNETLIARLSQIPEIETLASMLTQFAVQGFTVPADLYLEACTLIALQATHVPAHSSQSIAQNLAAAIVRALSEQTAAKLSEPAWLALPDAHLPGLDGGIMRTAAGNAILLGDSEEATISRLVEAPNSPEAHKAVRAIVNRLPARLGTARSLPTPPTEMRRYAANEINEYLHSLRVKRQKWLAAPDEMEGVLKSGSQRARMIVSQTLMTVQRALSSQS